MMRSFLSFSFLRPPNAILVPGMYFFGFSCALSAAIFRDRHCPVVETDIGRERRYAYEVFEQGVLTPGDCLLLVGIGVGESLDLTSLSSEESVKVWANLVGATLLESVALSTSRLEKRCALVLSSVSKELLSFVGCRR